MPFADKLPRELTEADLLDLIGVEPEGKTIDYKRDTVGATDADKKDFLYDASSFANTQGGYLVFGMDEAEGLPTELVGIKNTDPDKEILRLEQILRAGVRPAISGVSTAAIRVQGGNCLIVMRIPKSWTPPHQVTYQNVFRFYARASNGRYPIDVDELRSIFSLSATLADRIRSFRTERLARIENAETPVTMLGGGALVLHVVPFIAVSTGGVFPIQKAAAKPDLFPTLLDKIARRHQIAFEGLTVTSNLDGPTTPQRAYTQVLRSGAVEAVASSISRGSEWLILPHLEAIIIRYARLYMQGLRAVGVEPPVTVMATLVGVGGLRLIQDFVPEGALHEDMPSNRLKDQTYHLTDSLFESMPEDDATAASGLRGTLDHLANAAGLATSPYFDDKGNYTLKI